MTPQIKQLDRAINTSEMFELVNAYLLQRTYAEVTREQVDTIYASILAETPAYVATRWQERHEQERITKVSDLYLCDDNATLANIYAEADKQERAKGIKPADMPAEYCPALVAETELTAIEHSIIAISGKPMNVTVNTLLCSKNGIENLHQWLDLVVKAVFALPNFKPVSLKTI